MKRIAAILDVTIEWIPQHLFDDYLKMILLNIILHLFPGPMPDCFGIKCKLLLLSGKNE